MSIRCNNAPFGRLDLGSCYSELCLSEFFDLQLSKGFYNSITKE